jgi:RNA polymerase sigma-70 factor (ECF subfamily)
MGDQERDRSCIRRIQAGDSGALEELYDRHSPLLYSVAVRIVGRSAEAEEVLQDTWLQAWKRAGTYDPNRGTVTAWLLTLVRSRAIDRRRSLSSRQRAEQAVVDAPSVPVEESSTWAVRRQLHERVAKALDALSPEQRRVLELAYFGGLSQTEVAAQLGAPLGTVKSWTRQGLSRLRDLVPWEDWA